MTARCGSSFCLQTGELFIRVLSQMEEADCVFIGDLDLFKGPHWNLTIKIIKKQCSQEYAT